MRKKLIFNLGIVFFAVLLNITLCKSSVYAADERPITDGVYTISLAYNGGYAIDLSGSSQASGANIQLYQSNGSLAQKFKFVYQGNGYYKIISMVSGKALDVDGARSANYTNVQLWTSKDTNGQLWKLKETDGGYHIVSACGNKVLDVRAGNISNKANVQLYDDNGSNAQKFKLVAEDRVNNGIYTISSKANSDYVLDVSGNSFTNGGNIQIYTRNYRSSQKFRIKYVANGYYTIQSVSSWKMINISGGGYANKTNVNQWEQNWTKSQYWYIVKTRNGYTFVSELSGKVLDISGGVIADRSNISMYESNNSTAQQFNLESTSYNQIVPNGYYTINASANTGYSLDISGASKLNGGNLRLYQSNNTYAQKFYLEYIGDGQYKITAYCSNLALDVDNSGKQNRTNVQQYESNDSDAQKWYIYDAGYGTYSFESVCNNLFLDVAGGVLANGTNIQMYENNGSGSQKFKLTKTTVPTYRGWNTIDNRKYLYDDDGKLLSKTGIDVSSYQGDIDWNAVKNDGIDYAIIRVGYGDNDTDQDDAWAIRNMNECERLGIPYGVYLFSYALNEDQAYSEADHILRMIDGRNPQYGVYIDIEASSYYENHGLDYTSDEGRSLLTRITRIVLDKVSDSGYTVGVYANLDYYRNVLYSDQISEYKWLAYYGQHNEPSEEYSIPDGDWTSWQYTSRGSVSGIDGNVDMNVWIK